jgi:hypothetical protein
LQLPTVLNLRFKLCILNIQSLCRHVYSTSFISFLRPQSLNLSFPHVSLTPFVTSTYSALHLLQLTRENRRPFYLAHNASHLNSMLFRSIGFTVLNPNSFEFPAFSNSKQNSLTQRRYLWITLAPSTDFLGNILNKTKKNISYPSCLHFQFVVTTLSLSSST